MNSHVVSEVVDRAVHSQPQKFPENTWRTRALRAVHRPTVLRWTERSSQARLLIPWRHQAVRGGMPNVPHGGDAPGLSRRQRVYG
ncbi:hypothetical protein ElyMa_001809000 [Elysia marginata]|uniref:Uncharacterized protein n=1 Tax=Elysia marginata TaxID=1093978 RepID=A0AAV4EGW2_9GAST|nr:hypothetical protein ElyMa_001809000 [Elysia marginata]